MYSAGAAWPGEDVPPPVVFSGRPGRHRPRINSEHLPMPPPGTGPYYWGSSGYLIPAAPYGEGLYRTRSAANSRPAQVIINNDNTAYDDHSPSPRRPRSAHRERYYHYDHYDDHYERSRSRSRVRHSRRSPSPHHEHHDHHEHQVHQLHHPPPPDYETERRLRRLEELEKAEEEHRQKVHAEEQLILQHAREEQEKAERKKAAALEAAREEVEKAKKKKEEEDFKKKTIEEYNIKQKEEAEKKAKAKQKEDEEYKERLRKQLHANGFPDEEIESIIKNGEKGKVKSHHPPPVTGAISISRPTFIKVNRKYLEPETLDKYAIEWEFDDVC